MQSTTIQRNSFWLLLARFSVQGLAVVFVALAARRLGAGDFGQFSVIASLVMIGNTLTTFGTDTLIIREVAKAGHVTHLVAQSLGLQVSLSILWCAGVFLSFRDPPLWLYTLSLFPLAVFSIASAVLRAFQRMDLFWALNAASGVIQIAAGLLSRDLWSLCLYLFLGQILIAVLAVWMCKGFPNPMDTSTLLDFRPLWKLAWPFAALTTLTIVSQRLGILFTSALLGDMGAGLYSASARLVDGMKFGHYAVLGALLPMLASGHSQARNDFRTGFTAVIVFSAAMAGIAALFSKPVILIVYGNEFEPAANLLTVMCWSLLPYTLSSFISVDLVSRGVESKLLQAALFSIVAFAILFLLLIPVFGLQGAAYAALIGEIVQAAIFLRAWGLLQAENPAKEIHA